MYMLLIERRVSWQSPTDIGQVGFDDHIHNLVCHYEHMSDVLY